MVFGLVLTTVRLAREVPARTTPRDYPMNVFHIVPFARTTESRFFGFNLTSRLIYQRRS